MEGKIAPIRYPNVITRYRVIARFLIISDALLHLCICSVFLSVIKLTTELYCLLEHIAKGRHYGVYGSDAFAFLKPMGQARVTHGLMG